MRDAEPARFESPPGPEGPDGSYSDYIGARFVLHTWIRFIVAGTIAVGALFAKYLVGIDGLDVVPLLVLAALLAVENAVLFRIRATEPGRALRLIHVGIVLDFLALTAAIWLIGGARSPFLAFYLLHVILSCLRLSRRAALTFAALAYGLVVALVVLEWSGLAPPRLPAGAVCGIAKLDGRYALTIVVVYAMLISLCAFLLLTLARILRRDERRILIANAELRRVGDMRRDLLRMAASGLRPPVEATCRSLLALRKFLGEPEHEDRREELSRDVRRLEGIPEFMDGLLALSSLDAAMIEEKVADVDVLRMLAGLAEEYRETVEVKGLKLTLELPKSLPAVSAIERLLREAVVKLLTHAASHTPPGGEVFLRAVHAPPAVRIEVEDTGFGFGEKDRKRLFEEFAKPGDEADLVPALAHADLGLFVVKRVAEAFGGRTDVRSEPDWGNTLAIELPAAR